jgi:hypothetical protein
MIEKVRWVAIDLSLKGLNSEAGLYKPLLDLTSGQSAGGAAAFAPLLSRPAASASGCRLSGA